MGPGDRLGPFQLVRVLGQGGTGKVWEAKRVEGGFEQKVAIKTLRFLEPGSLAERRFIFEREVLGKLEHPAIASILDAGRTEAGAPYLVMEYVDGSTIADYCARHGLSIRDRVRLVVEICRVVGHAHRSLVIHRDLKPANILVTQEGEPRLLDFGIAKLMTDGSDRATLTAEGLGPMTPEYASPEQILSRPVTTASDVYSLGVVLYELLTGTTPFGSHAVAALARASLGQEAEITPPSRAPDTADEGAEASHSAGAGGPRGRRSGLSREVDRDLDNVVVHALRSDPDGRYPSMEAFAADLERWLGGFPVQARGDSLAYRSAKLIRRHWLALTAAVLVLISLTGGLGMATWQAKEAREQRIRADDQAQRTEQVNRFLVDLLAAPGGRWWRGLAHMGPETRVIDVLDEAADRLEHDLEDAPLQRAALHQTLNDTYLALGMPDRAEQQVRRALDIRRSLLGPDHLVVAESSYYLGATLKAQRRFDEALAAYRSAIAIEHSLPEPSLNLPVALGEAALASARIGLHAQAEELTEEALQVARASGPTLEGFLLSHEGYMLAQRAWLAVERGQLARAKAALVELERWPGNERRATGAATPVASRRRAIAWLSDNLVLAEATLRPPASVGEAFWRSQVLYDQGRYQEARGLLDEFDVSAEVLLDVRILRGRLALVLEQDPERCLLLTEPDLEAEEGWSRGPTWYLAEARSAVAACLAVRGQRGDAERARELLTTARQVLDELFDRPTPLHRRIERTLTGFAS